MPPVNTVICLSGFHNICDELRLMCYNHALAWCDNRIICGGAGFHKQRESVGWYHGYDVRPFGGGRFFYVKGAHHGLR